MRATMLSPGKLLRVRSRISHSMALRTVMRLPPSGRLSVSVSLPAKAQPAVTPFEPNQCLAC